MNAQELNRQLAAALAAQQEKRRLTRTISSLEADQQADMERLTDLGDRLQRELQDVDRLEGLSIQGLFYTVLGKKERQLDKERQEYLAAKLKHDQLAANVLEREKELAKARSRLHKLGDPEANYESLLAEKGRWLEAGGGLGAEALLDLGKRRSDQQARCRLIDEAIEEGKGLIVALDEGIGHLEKAESWGTWDMLGGGVVATALKHSEIDNAKKSVEGLQIRLKRFRRLMADADLQQRINADISGFDIFADYFLDNLIMDWVVQKRIKGSLEHVRKTQRQVADSIDRLESLSQDHYHGLEELESAWREIVKAS